MDEPPTDTFYHGVYPGHCQNPDKCKSPDMPTHGEEDDITPPDLQSYMSEKYGVGRGVAWVYFSHNWGRGKNRCFPYATAEWIRTQNRVPFIRLMLRDTIAQEKCDAQTPSEKVFTLQNINRGCFDKDLVRWGNAARDFGYPLIVEWGTEVNGCWFPWNGLWNGKAEGTVLFKYAYQRIVRIIRDDCGARNITWVFHANGSSWPNPRQTGNEWNAVDNYYPGDEFVDWIGLSVYGAQEPKKEIPCISFADVMDYAMEEWGDLKKRKPLYLLEFGMIGGHPGCSQKDDPDCDPKQCKASKWADDALSNLLAHRWPEVRGFSWWNETWKEEKDGKTYITNMRVQTVSGLRKVLQKHIKGNKKITDHPVFRKI